MLELKLVAYVQARITLSLFIEGNKVVPLDVMSIDLIKQYIVIILVSLVSPIHSYYTASKLTLYP